MSVELVRWAKKVGDFLSYPVGTQRACPLVPTDIRHMAVERAPPPLRAHITGHIKPMLAPHNAIPLTQHKAHSLGTESA